jgi:hypothetical protein
MLSPSVLTCTAHLDSCIREGNNVQLTEEIHSSFNPDSVTLDTHLDSCLQEHKVKTISDETFIRQVVYGVSRYSTMLTAVMKALFHYCGGVVLRKDRPTYRCEKQMGLRQSGWLSAVMLTDTCPNLHACTASLQIVCRLFSYLAIIRLDELGADNFNMLVSSQPAQKMLPFLEFLFDEKHVTDDLTEEWLKIYDREFVRDCAGAHPSGLPACSLSCNELLPKHRIHFVCCSSGHVHV